ncbi:hypothetical protein C8J57DRAFT_1084567 [Mycena rebaudengoi]|nr:hypothetical protein C8J57DRAFT_1084567 [Mycena rebaudengoi]
MYSGPLSGCGCGKDSIQGMSKVDVWAEFLPFVTRIDMSPLFAVTYWEPITRELARGSCTICRRKGKPKMMKCAARGCSKERHKMDWASHKPKCG